MNKLMLFVVGFVTSYLVVSYNITTTGLFATSMLVSVTFALLYAGYMGYLKLCNNNQKDKEEHETNIWVSIIEREYKKNENVDNRLSNPIFSHMHDRLLDEHNKHFNEALRRIMFGYHLEI